MLILYILNASPLSMFPAQRQLLLEWWPVTATEAAALLIRHEADGNDVRSALGHADLAALVSRSLGYPVSLARTRVVLKTGDQALVCQYRGPRLAEGATRLPEGAGLDWYWLRDWRAIKAPTTATVTIESFLDEQRVHQAAHCTTTMATD